MLTLRPYQNDAVAAIFTYFENGGKGNPLVAMPTGTGKSLVIADFVKRVVQTWPTQRIVCATHQQELIEGNYNKLKEHWQNAPASMYSAALNERDLRSPIVFTGIDSAVNVASRFGFRDLLLIDEAHLVSHKDDSRYQKFIGKLKEFNPALRVIGLSATPYRFGFGHLTDGNVFTDVCYDITQREAFNKLIRDGYLSRLVPRPTETFLDASGLPKNQDGDYQQREQQRRFDVDAITYKACEEMVRYGVNRRRWLTFATGIEHAEHIAATLETFGVSVCVIHSKLAKSQRIAAYQDFKHGRKQCCVNKDVMTTGVDVPEIDLIAVLRATESPGLWVQLLGRGTRIANGKTDCLVLDFARNTERLGPINEPRIPRSKNAKNDTGVAPCKLCPQCQTYNAPSVRFCEICAFEFTFQTRLIETAGTKELIREETPVLETRHVDYVIYHRHDKNSKPMIRVSYHCGIERFTEYLCFEHGGYAAKKAREWWRQRTGNEPPFTVNEALGLIVHLPRPKAITICTNREYPEIRNYVWE